MVSQTNLETLKKKDLEKQDEKLIKILMGLPLEITTPSNTLIPQITMTNIIVFPFKVLYTADLHMRPQRHQTNTMHHNIRPNNGGARDLSLHKAASCGDLARAQEVVQNQRDLLSLSDEEGNLPLHLAAQKGHKQVVTFLVNAYPQGSYALNHSRVSPLYYAVQCKDLELVEYMFCKLDKDYDDAAFHSLEKGKSIVRVAIGDNNQAMLETIVKHQPDLIKSRDEEGLTALSFAASKGYIDIASYILQLCPESIKNPNKDKTMSYPIHQAALGGHVEILKLFHNKFPQYFGYPDGHGQTVLHLAAKQRRNKLKSVVSYLLSLDEGRKLLDKEDENRNSPLDLAKIKGNRELEQEIIKNL